MDKDQKIITLEEKIAWLEGIIDTQSNELNNLYDRMDKLERQFRILYSKVGDPYATRAQKDEVPPPHY
ncbi:MAG: SlyX family protein [Succinivibrio sp.]